MPAIDVNPEQVKATMEQESICVVLPTFNNAATLLRVVNATLRYTYNVIVVNDGSTDSTPELLSQLPSEVEIVSYERNRGKGYALKQGFKRAHQLGYAYAITIDTDGQHRPSDIPLIVAAIVANPGALIVGQRDLSGVDINARSSFANKFSNFWFRLQTFRRLHDTQTGYRAYPLTKLPPMWMLSNRYEAELLLLVASAWRGVKLVEVPINVYYPPQTERVSHFRPGVDFARISLLNAILCLGALTVGLPSALWRHLTRLTLFNFEFRPFTRKKGKMRPAAITPGRLARSIWGLTFFVFGSIFIMVPATVIYFAIGRNSERKKLRFHGVLQRISRFMARNLPGAKVDWQATDEIDFNRPKMLVCNHQSHLDLIMLMALDRRIIFLTNDWVWRNPFYGPLIHRAEYLPVTMGIDELMPRLRDLTSRGYSIMVFPEGTRSATGAVGRFHQGAFSIASELGLPVLPLTLHGASDYLPKTDFMLRRGRLTLRAMPAINESEVKSTPPLKLAAATRRAISDELALMQRQIVDVDYLTPSVRYKYVWRGRNIVRACRRRLRSLPAEVIEVVNSKPTLGSVRIVNSGIGVEAFLIALGCPNIEVHAYEPVSQLHSIATSTGGRPANLHFHNPVWPDDYGRATDFDLTITLPHNYEI